MIKIQRLHEILENEILENEDYLTLMKNISSQLLSEEVDILSIRPDNIILDDNDAYRFEIFEKINDYDFSAPEIFNGEDATKTSYIYSLSLIFYFLLNDRKLPFQETEKNRSKQLALQQRFNGAVVPVLGKEKLDEFFKLTLSFHKENRIQSIEEYVNMLDNLSADDLDIHSLIENGVMDSVLDAEEQTEEERKIKPKLAKRKKTAAKKIKLNKNVIKYMIPVAIAVIVVIPFFIILIGSSSRGNLKENDIEIAHGVDAQEKKDTIIEEPEKVLEEEETVTEPREETPEEGKVIEEPKKVPEEEETPKKVTAVSGTEKNPEKEETVTEPEEVPEENEVSVTPDYIPEENISAPDDVAEEETISYMTNSQIGYISSAISGYVSDMSGASYASNLQSEASNLAQTGSCNLATACYASVSTSDVNDLDTIVNELCIGLDFDIISTPHTYMAVAVNVNVKNTTYYVSIGVVFE